MGILRRAFGGRKGRTPGASGAQAPSSAAYKQCDVCGKLAQQSEAVNSMNIFTATIEHWSLMPGYCPSCRRFLCENHVEWRNASPETIGPWEVVCSTCSVPVQSTL